MSLHLRRPAMPDGEFPLAPMIDMVFLLLVFFMSVSHIAQSERPQELDLPLSSTAKAEPTETTHLILTLDETGTIWLGPQRIDQANLATSIRAATSQAGHSVITLRAAADTPYSAIHELLRTVSESNETDLAFAVYEAP